LTQWGPALTRAPALVGFRALVIFKNTQCDTAQSCRTDFIMTLQHTLRYKNFSPFLFCTITFRGPSQGRQSGPAFAKASISFGDFVSDVLKLYVGLETSGNNRAVIRRYIPEKMGTSTVFLFR
jgi:hypothetical protein